MRDFYYACPKCGYKDHQKHMWEPTDKDHVCPHCHEVMPEVDWPKTPEEEAEYVHSNWPD